MLVQKLESAQVVLQAQLVVVVVGQCFDGCLLAQQLELVLPFVQLVEVLQPLVGLAVLEVPVWLETWGQLFEHVTVALE